MKCDWCGTEAAIGLKHPNGRIAAACPRHHLEVAAHAKSKGIELEPVGLRFNRDAEKWEYYLSDEAAKAIGVEATPFTERPTSDPRE